MSYGILAITDFVFLFFLRFYYFGIPVRYPFLCKFAKDFVIVSRTRASDFPDSFVIYFLSQKAKFFFLSPPSNINFLNNTSYYINDIRPQYFRTWLQVKNYEKLFQSRRTSEALFKRIFHNFVVEVWVDFEDKPVKTDALPSSTAVGILSVESNLNTKKD